MSSKSRNKRLQCYDRWKKNFFNQLVKRNTRTYDNIQKIVTGQWVNYTTACLFDYNYYNNNYKMITIELSKQQVLAADPKAIQQTNFTRKVQQRFSLLKKQKKPF